MAVAVGDRQRIPVALREPLSLRTSLGGPDSLPRSARRVAGADYHRVLSRHIWAGSGAMSTITAPVTPPIGRASWAGPNRLQRLQQYPFGG